MGLFCHLSFSVIGSTSCVTIEDVQWHSNPLAAGAKSPASGGIEAHFAYQVQTLSIGLSKLLVREFMSATQVQILLPAAGDTVREVVLRLR